MAFEVRTKRERCPACDATSMNNLVHMRPGRSVDVFVECATCGTFVARYTLEAYTCDDPFRSFLRRMRRRRQTSGGAVAKDAAGFKDELREEYETAKRLVAEKEETRFVEDLLDDLYCEERDD
jgi:formate dehydrogenase maturation protein FdhE